MTKSTRNPVMHNRQPSVYEGDYKLTQEALSNYDVTADKFGTTDIKIPGKEIYNVKDFQYVLDSGKVGMHLIPINDYGIIKGANGKETWASQLIDTFIREKTGIEPEDPLYAFMYYIHPELNDISIQDFATTDINEMGITHLGAYYGQGVTSNSPPLYHNRKWGVAWRKTGDESVRKFGYPCNVMTISMDGVDQAMLNKNFILTDKFLNYGVVFPINYKVSAFRMVDINTCLMFYRDWIMEEHYLKTDKTWFTYCAAHKTLVTTVALNLPHNEQSFKDVYGEKEGSDFWKKFIDYYFQLAGERFIEDDNGETYFTPLWQKEGLTPEQIRPFTHAEYNAYDKARREGTLASFKGFKPLKPTQATGWAPQSAADYIFEFVDIYADFIDAGAIIGCSVVIGFCPLISDRLGIQPEEYLRTAMPILETMMQAHALVYAALEPNPNYDKSKYYIETFAGLYIAYGGKKENIPEALKNFPVFEKYEGKLKEFIAFVIENEMKPEYLAWWSLLKVRENWPTIISKQSITLEDAYEWMKIKVKSMFEDAKNIIAPTEEAIQFNTPPAITHMIGVGMFDKNPHIELKTICTVMDHTELEPKT